MATEITDGTITARLEAYDKVHPTAEDKRDLAVRLITPGAELPTYFTTGVTSDRRAFEGTDFRAVRGQLSLLWAWESAKVRTVADYLWRLGPAAEAFAGQRAIIFQHGGKHTLPKVRLGESLIMRVGRLPLGAQPNHHFSGAASPEARPSTEGVQPPYARGLTTLPLVESRSMSLGLVGVGLVGLELGPIAPDRMEFPVYEATTHIGDNPTYSAETATDTVRIRRILFGDIDTNNFLGAVAAEANIDIQEAFQQA